MDNLPKGRLVFLLFPPLHCARVVFSLLIVYTNAVISRLKDALRTTGQCAAAFYLLYIRSDRSFMNYIVFDLEWNQCPYGKEKEEKRLPFEILEIGAIKLNRNLQELDRFHERIRPAIYPAFHYRHAGNSSYEYGGFQRLPFFSGSLPRFPCMDWEKSAFLHLGAV